MCTSVCSLCLASAAASGAVNSHFLLPAVCVRTRGIECTSVCLCVCFVKRPLLHPMQ